MPKVPSRPQRIHLNGYGQQMCLMLQRKTAFLSWGLSLEGGKGGLDAN